MILLGAQEAKITNNANAQAVIHKCRRFKPDHTFSEQVCDWMIAGSKVMALLRCERYNGNPVKR